MPPDELESIRNLGLVSADWLRQVGVDSKAKHSRLGPVVAYMIMKQHLAKTSLNLLGALAAVLVEKASPEPPAVERLNLQKELLRL